MTKKEKTIFEDELTRLYDYINQCEMCDDWDMQTFWEDKYQSLCNLLDKMNYDIFICDRIILLKRGAKND